MKSSESESTRLCIIDAAAFTGTIISTTLQAPLTITDVRLHEESGVSVCEDIVQVVIVQWFHGRARVQRVGGG